MNNARFIPILLLLIFTSAFSQRVDTSWVRSNQSVGVTGYGNWALATDRSGNICVTGNIDATGSFAFDYFTIKYLPNGDTAWVRRLAWPENVYDYSWDVACDDNGNVYVAGSSNGGFSEHPYGFGTIKYDSTGDTLWTRFYRGPDSISSGTLNAMVIDPFGDAVVTGYVTANTGTSADYGTIKYYPNGDVAWIKKYNGTGNRFDRANAVATDSDGNIYITGSSEGTGLDLDIVTIKYTANGSVAWIDRYNGIYGLNDYGNAITLDNHGSVYVTGISKVPGNNSAFVTLKFNASGYREWASTYGGTHDVYGGGTAIVADKIGNCFVTGSAFITIKYDPGGQAIWIRRYGESGGGSGSANAITLDSAENPIVTGAFADPLYFDNGYDFATVKYSSNGFQLWDIKYNTPGLPQQTPDFSQAVAVGPSGDIYITGGTTTIKYSEIWCGDPNHSGTINISDVVYLIRYIYSGGPEPIPLFSGDVNGDGSINLTDALSIINYVFGGTGIPGTCL